MPPVRRETVEAQVYKTLRAAILAGTLTGGQRLVQEELASELGTSRIPVRDALKRLEHDGLVSQGKRNSYLVNRFGPEDAAEVYAVRALLEPHAAELGLARLSQEGRATLRALFGEMGRAAEAEDAESYVALNARFHLLLYEASGRPRLLRMIESLWAGRPPLTPLHLTGRLEASQAEHAAILEAIDASDAEALKRRLREHIRRAGDELGRRLAERDDPATDAREMDAYETGRHETGSHETGRQKGAS